MIFRYFIILKGKEIAFWEIKANKSNRERIIFLVSIRFDIGGSFAQGPIKILKPSGDFRIIGYDSGF